MGKTLFYGNGKTLLNTLCLVYPLSEDGFNEAFLGKDCIGNYKIGTISRDKFTVCYIGRATEQTIRERLRQHKNTDFSIGQFYFTFERKSTDMDCYLQECQDYHEFTSSPFLQNKNHPSKLENDSTPCPICQQ